MNRIHFIPLLGLLPVAAFGQIPEHVNVACCAQVTSTPALAPKSARGLVDGSIGRGASFEVGTSGEGTVTFTFAEPRPVSGLRFYQSSEVYHATAYAVEADRDGDGTFEQRLVESDTAPLQQWIEHQWQTTTLIAIRLRCRSGVSKGRRAHPTLGEVEILGAWRAGDLVRVNAAGLFVPRLHAVRPLRRTTELVVNGRQPAVLASGDDAYEPAVAELLTGLAELGLAAERVSDIATAAPGGRTVICLGSMLDNPLIERLYWNRYTFVDALVPGTGSVLIHTVYDAYPYNGGCNIVVIGCSQPDAAIRGVKRFLGTVKDGELSYALIRAPQAESAASSGKVDPTFCDFTKYANEYLKTGEKAYADRACAAMKIMSRLYAPGGDREKPVGSSSRRQMPWPEETTSWEILCAWDAFEEYPGIDDELRLGFTNALLEFTRDLVSHVSGYGGIGHRDLVSWNHTTFPLLGVHFGARYFQRYYGLTDMPAMLAKAHACLSAQARSWKPQEDADGYLTLTTAHSQVYSLAEGQMDYFSRGNIARYADYMVGICDNMGLASGFGDSGVSSRPNLPGRALPLALWWTRDPGYKWLLQHYSRGSWENPYDRGLTPVRPDRFLGVQPFFTDPQVYEWVQSVPTYNERFIKADVPFAESFDKISFRENWEPSGQYLLLDGHARGKHLHYDANAIIEFVEGGERWLLDHDYLTRNTTEHAMLSVLRNGRADQLIPSLAGLSVWADLPELGYTDTYVRDYSACNWRRQILWCRGEWFLVADTVTARSAGDYDLELTWKTMDETGHQTIVDADDFVAERGGTATRPVDCTMVDDPSASGGKALLMGRGTSVIAFGIDLPDGDYSLSIIGYGVDGSSDSLWGTVDTDEKQAFHLPKERYGASAGDHALSSDTPNVRLTGGTSHAVVVKLRERPPVRIDRFVLRDARGQEHVFEAENLPPAPPASEETKRVFRVQSVTPVKAWVTNHERAGITVPVSVLHQRRSGRIEAGASAAFVSLLSVSRPDKRRTLDAAQLAPNLIAVRGSADGIALLGDVDAAGIRADVHAGLLTGSRICLAGLRRLDMAGHHMEATAPVDLQIDWRTRDVTLRCRSEGEAVTVRVGQDRFTVGADGPTARRKLGQHSDVAGYAELVRSTLGRQPPAADAETVVESAAPAPAWSALGQGDGVACMKVADLADGLGPQLFVCRGSQLHCLARDGALRWSFATQGQVRDVAFGDVRQSPGLEVVLGSADASLYVLSGSGELLDRHEMRGIPWARSFGDRAFGVFSVLVGDITGDAKPEIVATLQNFDLVALTPDWDVLWRRDHALHGSTQASFEDGDGDGVPDLIFVGDKYGSTKAADFSGQLKHRCYTSIGDVHYVVVDLDGDAVPEVVTGSSTGDMVAAPCGVGTPPLWRFDNFGYPVNRLHACDLDDDGAAEVLMASGTGYLYVLNGQGEVRWQDRVGRSVNDIAVLELNGEKTVAYADQGGTIRLARAHGKRVLDLRTPSAPMRLSSLNDGDQVLLVAALADGRVAAYRVP